MFRRLDTSFFVGSIEYRRTSRPIFTKFGGKVGRKEEKTLDFVGNRDNIAFSYAER